MSKYDKEYQKRYRETHKEYFKQYRELHKEEIKEKNKQRRNENHEYYLAKEKENYLKNHKSKLESSRKWKKNNRDKINEYERKRKKEKIFLLKTNTRKLIRKSFDRKGFIKNSKTETILGCSYDCFIKHLLNTYKNNYGYEWDGKEKVHIDHIKPLKFAKTEEEVIELCYYSNLQLLKEKDNLEKGSKIDWQLIN